MVEPSMTHQQLVDENHHMASLFEMDLAQVAQLSRRSRLMSCSRSTSHSELAEVSLGTIDSGSQPVSRLA